MWNHIGNFAVFLIIWALGCYLIEYVFKVRDIPWAMMSGYFVVRLGFWVADSLFKI